MKTLFFLSVTLTLFSCATLQPATGSRIKGALYDSDLKIVVINGDTLTKDIVTTAMGLDAIFVLKEDGDKLIARQDSLQKLMTRYATKVDLNQFTISKGVATITQLTSIITQLLAIQVRLAKLEARKP